MSKFSWAHGLLLTVLFLILAGASWRCGDETTLPKTTVAPAESQTALDAVPDAGPEAMPTVVSQVAPAYPELAKKAGVEGLVYLQVRIDKEGRVGEVQTIKCDQPNQGFEEAASEAVRKWVFKPAQKNGEAVAATITIPFNFKLAAEKSPATSN